VARPATVSTIGRKQRERSSPPAPPDPVTGYALDVVAGRVVAGVLVRKACERHLADLANGAERGLRFDVDRARRAIEFFGLLRHYKGEWGPLPGIRTHGLAITLEPWQQFLVGALFGWLRADGTRRYRTAYIEVAKKNGKTLIAAGLGILLAFFDGEPGAEVYSFATKRDQAKLVWNDAVQFVEKNAGLKRRIKHYALSLVHETSASVFKPLGEDAGTSDQGINAHGYIVDELHVIENRDGIDNLETATSARRQPLGIKITTAGVKRDSVWSSERADAVAVVEGRVSDDSMLVLIYTLDEGDDPFDESVWPKSNPNLNVSVNLETLREQAAKARRSPAALAGFLRLRLNVPTGVAAAALDIDEWDACSGITDEDLDGVAWTPGAIAIPLEVYDRWLTRQLRKGQGCYGGLDLASVRDITALLLLFRTEAGKYVPLCRFYCPEDGAVERSRRDGVPYLDWIRDGWLVATPGNVTDYDFVLEDLLTLARQYSVGQIGYDTWNATQLAVDLENAGADMIPVHQTHAGLAPSWREIMKDLAARDIEHGGHPILRWMMGNVEAEIDAQGNEKPSKRHSAEKIDGAIALTMARGRWLAQGGVGVWSAA
jgi:phage terminase large subunit-like protein